MITTYVTHPHPVGFCNNLYYALYAYIQLKNKQSVVQCLTDKQKNNKIYESLCKLNLSSFFTTEKIKSQPIPSYIQILDSDFTLEQLEAFIKQYILTSEPFLNYKQRELSNSNCLAIHIRNGDYLDYERVKFLHDCFDRKQYLRTVMQHPLISNFKEVNIFSDDIPLCIKQYNDILTEKFQKVIYIQNKNFIDDFIELCFYKNKVLWNSTFSYWTAFVSDVISNYTGTILYPNLFMENILSKERVSPLWISIPVKPKIM